MPLYVYKCPSCDRQLELMQKVSEKIAPHCSCEHGDGYQYEMEPVITSSTFILKGSGWAKDGYSGGKK